MSESKSIGSVRCDVVSCAYNDDHCHCTAPVIEVGTQNKSCTASCSAETVCATFRPKQPYKTGYRAF